jgi:glutamyl-tRNA synthetase
MSEIRVRFAPSPTGYLHIGGARTVIYNWLFARKHGGKLILRIEDTDAERSTQASIDGIIEGLKWLGIDWDEGPYFQTQFMEEHGGAAKRLLAEGKAYKCFCTKEVLDEKREVAKAAKKNVGYDGTCCHLTPDQVSDKEAAGVPFVIRFKVPGKEGAVTFEDKVLGRQARAYTDMDDFVIVRSNGMPLFLLTNVVDDIRDRITHVIRGQDHLTNTARQILLYDALNAVPPVFAHMPLAQDPQKAKISKRKHGEIVAIQFYKRNGFIPWALVNFLVLLGWSPGNDQEIFSKEELIEAFTLERINKSSVIFNYRKDDPKFFTDPKAISINTHYLKTMPTEAIADLVKIELENAGLWNVAFDNEKKEWYVKTIDLIRDRFHTIKDFLSFGRAYFSDDFEMDPKALKKNITKYPDLTTWLPVLADRFETADRLTSDTSEKIAKEVADELGIKPGILLNAARTLITGQIKGPSIFELFTHFDKTTILDRLRNIHRL